MLKVVKQAAPAEPPPDEQVARLQEQEGIDTAESDWSAYMEICRESTVVGILLQARPVKVLNRSQVLLRSMISTPVIERRSPHANDNMRASGLGGDKFLNKYGYNLPLVFLYQLRPLL